MNKEIVSVLEEQFDFRVRHSGNMCYFWKYNEEFVIKCLDTCLNLAIAIKEVKKL